eukprot:7538987-Pyramimonas_sp.AAC.1
MAFCATLRRRRRRWLKPEDMSKQEVGNAFKKARKKLGQGPNLEKARQRGNEQCCGGSRGPQPATRLRHLSFGCAR